MPAASGYHAAMTRNIGTLDMVLRLVFAGVLFALGFLPNPFITAELPQRIVGWFGLVPLTTALLRFCPLYTLIGVSTCPVRDKAKAAAGPRG